MYKRTNGKMILSLVLALALTMTAFASLTAFADTATGSWEYDAIYSIAAITEAVAGDTITVNFTQDGSSESDLAQVQVCANNPDWVQLDADYELATDATSFTITLSQEQAEVINASAQLFIQGKYLVVSGFTCSAAGGDVNPYATGDWVNDITFGINGITTAAEGDTLTFAFTQDGASDGDPAQIQVSANDPEWAQIDADYDLALDATSFTITLTAEQAELVNASSQIVVQGKYLIVGEFTYTPVGSDSDSDTDSEIVDGIVIYDGDAIEVTEWSGSFIANLPEAFVPQEGGVLVATFIRGNSPQFKFAANNPEWNELLSGYFNEWDCIDVTADTMQFTLAADDVTAFEGESEIWITGKDVAITRLVYVPVSSSDTDSEEDSDSEPEDEIEIVDGYYYVNGEKVLSAGVVNVAGDLYYIGMRGQVFTGTVYVTEAKTNGLVQSGMCVFGADGKLVIENGAAVVDGRYYVDGVLTKNAGIIQFAGSYYYIDSKGRAFVGTIYVTEAKANGLLEAGKYTFDADGLVIS